VNRRHIKITYLLTAPEPARGRDAASTMPPSYIRVRAVVWAYGRGQTHRQTDRHTHREMHVTTIHFASSTTHAKCNNYRAQMQLEHVENKLSPLNSSVTLFTNAIQQKYELLIHHQSVFKKSLKSLIETFATVLQNSKS